MNVNKREKKGEWFCTSEACRRNLRHGEVGNYLGIDGWTFKFCPFCGVAFVKEEVVVTRS